LRGRQESRNTGDSTKGHERPIIDRKQLTQKTATKIRDMLSAREREREREGGRKRGEDDR